MKIVCIVEPGASFIFGGWNCHINWGPAFFSNYFYTETNIVQWMTQYFKKDLWSRIMDQGTRIRIQIKDHGSRTLGIKWPLIGLIFLDWMELSAECDISVSKHFNLFNNMYWIHYKTNWYQKIIGLGIEKNGYWKNVSYLVLTPQSIKFSNKNVWDLSVLNIICKIWYRKKLRISFLQIFGISS